MCVCCGDIFLVIGCGYLLFFWLVVFVYLFFRYMLVGGFVYYRITRVLVRAGFFLGYLGG